MQDEKKGYVQYTRKRIIFLNYYCKVMMKKMLKDKERTLQV